MRISKYTFLFDVNDTEFYVYNTVSNALVEIDKDSYLYLQQAKVEKSELSVNGIDKKLYDVLVAKKFITDNDQDNLLFYKSVIIAQRTSKSQMHLTLAPTMDCCFKCHYCFEKYKDKNYMTEAVMDSIIKYQCSLPSKPEVKITWFGGEPLMATSQMEQFYDKFVAEYGKPSRSNVITTGFHLNKETIQVLKKLAVVQVQITLDGLKETHNAIKSTPDCDDAFTKVLDNVELLLSTSDIHVVFRVNLTKLNAHEYVDLYRLLSERFKNYKNYGIAPAFVMDRGACSMEGTADFFTGSERTQFILDLQNKYKIHSPFIRYPSKTLNECAIRNSLAISFDPEGYAYKCWEVIGNREYAVGKLNNDGVLQVINDVVLNRQMYGADPLEDPVCSGCKYLPICHGGCPVQRIENTFENKHNHCCTHYKGHLEDFLKIHLALKKMGVENK